MSKVRLKGADKLIAGLEKRQKLTGVQALVKKHTAQLQVKAQQRTSTAYTGHYEGTRFVKPTGATKRGIKLEIADGGLSGIVGMSMSYNPYLENGTRFMHARPVLKPTFTAQKIQFVNELKLLMK